MVENPAHSVPRLFADADADAVKAAYTFFDRATPNACSKGTGNW